MNIEQDDFDDLNLDAIVDEDIIYRIKQHNNDINAAKDTYTFCSQEILEYSLRGVSTFNIY